MKSLNILRKFSLSNEEGQKGKKNKTKGRKNKMKEKIPAFYSFLS